MSAVSALATDHPKGRTRYPTGHARNGRGYNTPHQGEREIARRLRQRARDEQRQIDRLTGAIAADRVKSWNVGVQPHGVVIGLSRRGRFVVV